jgi:pyruvate,water dikinase
MTDVRTFDQITPGDGAAVGGKGLSLGLMAGAGLPVPPGFCVTSAAHRRWGGQSPALDAALAEQVSAAYRGLGGGPVAVRSSATAEDGVVSSFAGQQETVLGVEGEQAVCEAVARCWASLDSERAAAYRAHQGVHERGLAMAVVVQRLVPAAVAGVLFTRDPLDTTGSRLLVEASWGLGESVVSGRVSPDRYHIDRATGRVVEQHISVKAVEMTASGPRPVPPGRQGQPCLAEGQLAELAELGRRVEAFYGEPRDVEWAWVPEGADGGGSRFWLLQARPITAGAGEREQVRREEVAALAVRADPRGTVWSRFSLSEVLPEPTPMTWAIVRRFMSGRGGFGLMYRDLGFHPDPSLDEEGVYDLVAGRPYLNLSREPLLYSGWLPHEHPFAALKADPRRAFDLQPVPRPSLAGPAFWLFLPFRLPFLFLGAVRSTMHRRGLLGTFAGRFRQEVLPAFAAETAQGAGEDLGRLDVPTLLGRLEFWVRRTLHDFARDGLKPTALAALARGNVQVLLQRKLGPERTREALNELSMGVRPDAEADLAGALADLATGRLDQAAFLERFGHRGSQEMELARPRWHEDPAGLAQLIESSRGARPGAAAGRDEGPVDWWERVSAEAKLSALERTALEPEVRALQTYLGLRETAKHYLMCGYALIRRVLVELDSRHGLHGGLFFLTPDELPGLAAGQDVADVIARRRRRRALALSLEAPAVLFSDDLEALGRPVPVEGAQTLQGVALSAGVAEAPALVLDRPRPAQVPGEPYILVCPSTDPEWVPLFLQARGLVMETGGVLSHGAIVAREFGLPAVAGLPGVLRRLRTGQRVRVDGGRGTVAVLPG